MDNADSLQDRLELVQTIVVGALPAAHACMHATPRQLIWHLVVGIAPAVAATLVCAAPKLCLLLTCPFPPARHLPARLQETASAAGHEGEPMLQCFF